MSGVSFPSLPLPVGNITIPPDVYKINQPWMKFLSNVTIIYLNNIISTKHYVYLNNITFELQVENSFTEIHLSGYSVPVFEVKIQMDSNHLQYLDLSNNKIERLSPDSLAYLEHLKIVDLSNNKLALSQQFEDTFLKLF